MCSQAQCHELSPQVKERPDAAPFHTTVSVPCCPFTTISARWTCKASLREVNVHVICGKVKNKMKVAIEMVKSDKQHK